MPRGRLGRKLWDGPSCRWRGARAGTAGRTARAPTGLPPLEHVHGGISRELALVATLPELEYPRSWPRGGHVDGSADVGAARE